MVHRRTRSVFAAILVAVAAIVVLPLTSFAQTFRGGINGTVTDQSGAVVPGATVEATDSATGVSHKTITSSAGEYSFQDMPLGAYTVKVATSGFKSSVINKVPVTAGVIYTLPIKLSIESTGETVEVSASGLGSRHHFDYADDSHSGSYRAGYSTEWSRFHADDRNGSGLCRICTGRIRVSEWYARKPGQLADRWRRQ